jgi:Ni/Fe-hydrogenase 1 B-type cytochrome subunit
MRAGDPMLAGKFDESGGAMTTSAHAISRTSPSESEGNLVRVYVWQWPVRIAHWMIFLSIVVLSFTGYYLYDPFIISRGNGAFVMGKIRFIHEVTAFVLIAAFLLRVCWFFNGNKWARWRQFLPIGRQQWQDFVGQLEYYLFIRRKPVFRVGHNPLAGGTYSIIYALMLIEILTGTALYNHILGNKVLGFFISWLPLLISVRHLREIHLLIMFAFGAFVIHHVYSAVLIAIEERSGLVGGIFSGYKFISEGRVKEDALHK